MTGVSNGSSDSQQLQIRLHTKAEELAVADAPLSVPAAIDADGLSNLVNELLAGELFSTLFFYIMLFSSATKDSKTK